MFEVRKLMSRLFVLGILLTCLGFAITASSTETASASQLVFCQSCDPVPGQPHMVQYCSWYVINDCATEAPLKSTLACLPPATSCLP